MLPSGTLIQTKEGVLPIDVAGETIKIWTGADYVHAIIGKDPKLQYPIQIELEDQTIVKVLPHSPVLIANREEYGLRLAERLKVGDLMCASMGVGLKLCDNYRRNINYWAGCVFGGGLHENNNYNFIVDIPNDHVKRSFAADTEPARMSTYGGKIKAFIREKRAYVSVGNGSRIINTLKEAGGKLNERKFFEALPPGMMLINDRNRREFCRGILDTTIKWKLEETSWRMKLKTKQRLIDTRHMFRSIGLTTTTEPGNILKVPKWTTSIDLYTYTDYPKRHHIIGYFEKGAPSAVVDDYLHSYEGRKIHNNSGFSRSIYNLIKNKEIKCISPAALRICWRVIRRKPKIPIYDLVPITKIVPIHEPTTIYTIEVDDIDNLISANGYVIGDSIC